MKLEIEHLFCRDAWTEGSNREVPSSEIDERLAAAVAFRLASDAVSFVAGPRPATVATDSKGDDTDSVEMASGPDQVSGCAPLTRQLAVDGQIEVSLDSQDLGAILAAPELSV